MRASPQTLHPLPPPLLSPTAAATTITIPIVSDTQDLEDVIESTKLLKEAQAKEDSAEAKASLPTLSVADLERKVKSIPIEITSVQGVDVITHDVPSSGEMIQQV